MAVEPDAVQFSKRVPCEIVIIVIHLIGSRAPTGRAMYSVPTFARSTEIHRHARWSTALWIKSIISIIIRKHIGGLWGTSPHDDEAWHGFTGWWLMTIEKNKYIFCFFFCMFLFLSSVTGTGVFYRGNKYCIKKAFTGMVAPSWSVLPAAKTNSQGAQEISFIKSSFDWNLCPFI